MRIGTLHLPTVRKRTVHLISGALLWVMSILLAGSVMAAKRDCSKLIVTGNPEYPPWLWARQDGGMVGIAAQLLREALASTPWTPEFRAVPTWARAQAEVRLGRVDMLAGAFMTQARKNYMDYILPAIAEMPNVIFVRKQTPIEFTQWSDLIPYQGATLLNNSFGQDFDNWAKEHLRLEGVSSVKQAFGMLRQGRVDYVVFELYQGDILLKTLGWEDELVALPTPVNAEGLYFTVGRNSPCNNERLRTTLTQRVNELVSKGRPKALEGYWIRDWLSRHTGL